MSVCLGLDTSNYTTSAAIWQDGAIHQVKRLLPVKPGELGLRQSDAVFHHVRQLPDIVEELRGLCDAPITAIAASDRPQQREGSYMPCFLAGMGAARELAAVLHVPCYRFTHQQGHVAAGMAMLLAYSLGLGVPFLLSAVLIDRLKGAFDWIKRNYRIINLISGGLLVLVGILMATGTLGRLISLLS